MTRLRIILLSLAASVLTLLCVSSASAEPGGHIAGTARAQSGGAPIQGIVVQPYLLCVDPDFGEYWSAYDPGALTGADGAYQLRDLVPGTWRLEFTDPSGTYLGEFYDSTSTLEAATDVTLTVGETQTVSVYLDAAPRIEGTVRDAGGVAIAGAKVRAIRLDDWPWVDGETTSDASGGFRLTCSPGDFKVACGKTGYVSEYSTETASLGLATTITAQANDVITGVDFSLTPSGTVVAPATTKVNSDVTQRTLVKRGPRVHGDHAVWQDAKRVYLRDLVSGETTVVHYDYDSDGSHDGWPVDLNDTTVFLQGETIDIATGARSTILPSYEVYGVACDDSYVAFAKSEELVVRRLSDGLTRTVPMGDAVNVFPGAVAGGRVAMQVAYTSVKVYDFASDTTTDVPVDSGGGIQPTPVIAGGYVVWNDASGALKGRNLGTGADATLVSQPGPGWWIHDPRADGDSVVFEEWTFEDYRYKDVRIKRLDVPSSTVTTVVAVTLATPVDVPPFFPGQYDVADSRVAWLADPAEEWAWGSRIDGRDLPGPATFRVDVETLAPSTQLKPSVSSAGVAWLDNRNHPPSFTGEKWDLYFRASGGPEALVATEVARHWGVPRIEGQRLVYIKPPPDGDGMSLAVDVLAYDASSGETTKVGATPDSNYLNLELSGDDLYFTGVANSGGLDESWLQHVDLTTGATSSVTTIPGQLRIPIRASGTKILYRGANDEVWLEDADTHGRVKIERSTPMNLSEPAAVRLDYPWIVFVEGRGEGPYWGPLIAYNVETHAEQTLDPFVFLRYADEQWDADDGLAVLGSTVFDIARGDRYVVACTPAVLPYDATFADWLRMGLDLNGRDLTYLSTSDSPGDSSDVYRTTLASIAAADEDTVPPAAVSELSAVSGDTSTSLAWTNPPDADYQATRILRSTVTFATSATPGGDQTQVYEGTGTAKSETGLTNATTYYWTAYARDTAGNWSTAATASATPRDTTPPGPCTALAAYPGKSKVTLAWTRPVADFEGTRILRSSVAFATSPTDTVNQFLAYEGALASRDITGTNGTRYYYTLYAYDAAGNFSAPTTTTAVPWAYATLGRPKPSVLIPRRNIYFYTSGTISPKHLGSTTVRLYFYRLVSGRYRYYRYVKATVPAKGSAYRYRYRVPYAGKWYVRAHHADANHLARFGPIRYFAVR